MLAQSEIVYQTLVSAHAGSFQNRRRQCLSVFGLNGARQTRGDGLHRDRRGGLWIDTKVSSIPSS